MKHFKRFSRLLIFALFSVYILLTWFVGIYVVPTASMEPTIQTGSLIFVLKLPYVFRTPDHIPFTTVPINKVFVRELVRFRKDQIVVFDSPINFKSHPSERMTFVKRLRALPGDTIKYAYRRFLTPGMDNYEVSGVEMVIPFSGMTITLDSITFPAWKTTIERDLGTEIMHGTILDEYRFSQDFFYFSSDKPYSSDSRRWGLVPATHLRGRVIRSLN